MTTSLDMIRGRSNIVTMTNNSGGALIAGDVCIQDTTADENVTTTTSAASTVKVFIAAESIGIGAAGKFYESGYCPFVNVSASATRGYFLFTHTVAKQATSASGYAAGAFGRVLKAGTSPSAIIYSQTAQISSGVTRSGGTTDGHIAVWNGSSADSIRDGGLVSSGIGYPQDFRLTLTTGVPVTTADVTAATTLYCTPYRGNCIALYDGAAWNIRTSVEMSITLASLTASKPYDVFCYDNSGTPTLELTAWTNTTTRATALAYQDGVLVKSGAATRRYLGTICITGVTGQCEDSLLKRLVWNYYNRVSRYCEKSDTTSHTYTTAAWQYWNNSAASSVALIIGVAEEAPLINLVGRVGLAGAGAYVLLSLGLDSATGSTTKSIFFIGPLNFGSRASLSTIYPCGIGYHFYAAAEYSDGSNASSFVDFTLDVSFNG